MFRSRKPVLRQKSRWFRSNRKIFRSMGNGLARSTGLLMPTSGHRLQVSTICVVQSHSSGRGDRDMTNPGHHFVALIGGAISGSVAAEILADHGIRVAVFEQNTRPYGKIEDGLPRWHVEQRRQEYARIDARMKKPNVYFIPSTKLGRDFNLPQLFEWGFSAVILANGAWRDRELGVPEAEQYVGKGLVYQNPFIYWYNHKNEKDYR